LKTTPVKSSALQKQPGSGLLKKTSKIKPQKTGSPTMTVKKRLAIARKNALVNGQFC